MEWIFWTVLVLAILSALSAGLALGLHLMKPQLSEKRRILWSAGIAGLAPGSVAFLGFLSEVRITDDEFGLGLLAMIVAQLVVLAVFTLPPAWFATTKLGAADSEHAPRLPNGGETQLIG